MCTTLPAYAVLTELRSWDSVKTIVDYAGLPSTCTRKETKVLAPRSFNLPMNVLLTVIGM